MTTTQVLPVFYRTHMVNQLIESINEASNTAYYVFVSNHVPRPNTSLTTPKDTVNELETSAKRNMLFGKRVSNNDVAQMVRKVEYASGTLYTMYDDTDATLYSNNFFVFVNESSYYHVYKCLDNNLGTNSTVEPQFSHIVGSNTAVYQTSDGYRWKYMYSIPSATYTKFATSGYIPVVSNTTVEGGAVDGSIDVVKITTAGKNYNNYFAGTFAADDLRYGGSSTIYKVANSNLNQTNGFYTGCLMYLSSGTGSGQYEHITDFYSNALGSFAVINSTFSTPPVSGTTYEVNPLVDIKGGGKQTINAVARALVNSLSTNSIYRVEMINRGAGYEYATATVIANAVVGVTQNASVRPIQSPSGGHGKNPASELGCSWFGLSVNFSNSESNTIPTVNGFDKVGILRDPLFVNVNIEHSSTNGSFIANEQFYKINPVRINTNASINTTSVGLVCATGDLANQISTGDLVYLQSSNGTAHQIATINVVSNATYASMASNGYFACTETIIYQANVSTTGYVTSTPNSTNILVSSVAGQLSTGDILIGVSSGAKMVVNSTSRAGVSKGFDTFIGMHKYTGTVTANSFSLNEIVYQGSNLASSTANGVLHSAVSNGATVVFYVSNVVGTFVTTSTLKGANSSSEATLTTAHPPEIEFGSGGVMYLENVDTVTRQNNQSETFQTVISFNQG